jgi:hypothetical protein
MSPWKYMLCQVGLGYRLGKNGFLGLERHRIARRKLNLKEQKTTILRSELYEQVSTIEKNLNG